jgi:hypothetical protein
LILKQRLSAESAVQAMRYADVFEKIQSRKLGDIIDIERRMLKRRRARRDLSRLTPAIVGPQPDPQRNRQSDTTFSVRQQIGGPAAIPRLWPRAGDSGGGGDRIAADQCPPATPSSTATKEVIVQPDERRSPAVSNGSSPRPGRA